MLAFGRCGALLGLSAMTAAAVCSARAQAGSGSREIMISVPGVPGPYCVYGIDKRVRELSGVEHIEFLWPEEKIRVVLSPQSRVTAGDVRAAVEHSEYPYRFSVEP